MNGEIAGNEVADFVHIQKKLEIIFITVETLQLWSERIFDIGAINKVQYEGHRRMLKQG